MRSLLSTALLVTGVGALGCEGPERREAAQIVEATSRGGLASARAQVSGSTSAVSGARAQVAVARSALTRAQADQHKAELDLGRADALRKAGAISQASLDTAQASFDAPTRTPGETSCPARRAAGSALATIALPDRAKPPVEGCRDDACASQGAC